MFFVCTPALLLHSLVTSDLSVVFSSTLVIAGGLCVGHRCGLSAHRGLAAPADSRTDHRRIVVVVCEQRQPRLPIAIFVLDDASFIARCYCSRSSSTRRSR